MKTFPSDRQLDMMDCGPACLKMIAKFYGRFYSLQFMRDKCGSTKEGTTFLGLSHAAEGIGLRTLSIKCTKEELLLKIPYPAIIHWDNSHFVVVYNAKSKVARNGEITGTIYVSDPAKGLLKYDINEFCDKWLKKEGKIAKSKKGC